MSLFLHLSMHVLTSLLAGYFVWIVWRTPKAVFLAAFAGGVLIDLDHFIDYWLAFGGNFRWDYFASGYQFLKSDKIYILLHGWEYVIILLVLAIWVSKNKTVHPVKSVSPSEIPKGGKANFMGQGGVEQFNGAKSAILALVLGIFFHLGVDTLTNGGAQFKTYSIIYRMQNNFDLKYLVTPEHYQDHQVRKSLIEFEK